LGFLFVIQDHADAGKANSFYRNSLIGRSYQSTKTVWASFIAKSNFIYFITLLCCKDESLLHDVSRYPSPSFLSHREEAGVRTLPAYSFSTNPPAQQSSLHWNSAPPAREWRYNIDDQS
jgi:hypothetical protein